MTDKQPDAWPGDGAIMIDRLRTFGAWAEPAHRHALVRDAADMIAAMAERDRALREALGEAIDVFEGMNDDEIDEELLPRLRAILASTGDAA